ncbi:MAG TPA: glycosyltransferase family 9 protein [Candidatus Sumerlaeota bacterium]|nr:glycosyltransferase family 9 protein [Candidatus Sumerlaeota bacterium]HNM46110.1 glycosyltransferase family 9 protein [Candidatus Sumerlaeota bacterium]
MTSFANIRLDEIKRDCRYYTGYKPCHRFDGCPDCPHYAPRGEQILIIKLGAMGDVLRTKAILPGLKREHPTSWIVWLTEAGSESLARDPQVDEVVTFNPAGLLQLEGRRFARLICLDKDRHAVALAARIEADRKQGFAPTEYNTISVWNEAAMYALRLGLSDELKYRINEKSMPQIVTEACELPWIGDGYSLMLNDAMRAAADKRWREILGARGQGKTVIGLNTGCGPVFATKGWSLDRMKDFVELMRKRNDVVLMLLGGPREREIHRELMRVAGPDAGVRVFDSGNDNPLEFFFALVAKCSAVLTADSLALHIAVALQVPVVSWFGPTCAQEIDLYGRGEKLVTDFACAPCYLKVCPKEVTCMESLSAQAVADAMDRVLAASAS